MPSIQYIKHSLSIRFQVDSLTHGFQLKSIISYSKGLQSRNIPISRQKQDQAPQQRKHVSYH